MTQEKTAIIYLGKDPPSERARNLTDWCERNEVTPLGEFTRMSDLLAAKGLSVEPIDMVVVEDVSHFSEDRVEAEALIYGLQQAGVRTIEVSSGLDLTEGDDRSGDSRYARKIIETLKNFRKGSHGKRLAIQRAEIRRAGKKCEGRKPYGFRPGEQDTLNRMFELSQTGLGCIRVSRALNAEGHTTRCGKPWTPRAVRWFLQER